MHNNMQKERATMNNSGKHREEKKIKASDLLQVALSILVVAILMVFATSPYVWGPL
jgi:hypothetical protein